MTGKTIIGLLAVVALVSCKGEKPQSDAHVRSYLETVQGTTEGAKPSEIRFGIGYNGKFGVEVLPGLIMRDGKVSPKWIGFD